MQPLSLTGRADRLGRHAVAFLGFSIPISVALDNVLLAVIALLWIAGGGLRQKIESIRANAVALAALALFGILAAGVFYGVFNPGDGRRYLSKYLDLLFIPVFIAYFQQARTRELALRWFCAAMILTFLVAELAALGLLDGNALLNRHPGYPGAFRASITHGFLAAFAAFLFALLAWRERDWPRRALFAVLALVAVKNVFLIAISRTAYVVLALLVLYFFFILYRKRGVAAAGLLLVALFAAFYGSSSDFRERVDTVVVESGNWQSRWPSRESVTVRQEWARESLGIVLDHPVLGTGTGSFPRVYAEAVAGRDLAPTQNPHNEYLLVAVQTGMVGLALLIHLFWQQLRLAQRLATPVEVHLARGLVIAVAVGCLFNSFLLDHTEGLFFAWFTGLLYGGLQPQPPPERDVMPGVARVSV